MISTLILWLEVVFTKIETFLSFNDLEVVIHAFIMSRLDYCNSLYYGVSHASISHLQLVQNAAARLLTGTRTFVSITPVLASLHWLPVKFRIQFNYYYLFLKV